MQPDDQLLLYWMAGMIAFAIFALIASIVL